MFSVIKIFPTKAPHAAAEFPGEFVVVSKHATIGAAKKAMRRAARTVHAPATVAIADGGRVLTPTAYGRYEGYE